MQVMHGFMALFVFYRGALGADLTLPASILADKVSQQNKTNEATQYYAIRNF